MPDISPINPANNVDKTDPLIPSKKLQQKATLLTESLSPSSKETSDEFGSEIINQINNDFAKLWTH